MPISPDDARRFIKHALRPENRISRPSKTDSRQKRAVIQGLREGRLADLLFFRRRARGETD
ncbi:MAG TPA: hypothetical protein VLB73_03155 [Patescibacteria group bacterium]|nr:hypothetical protein [Patescibacteria group bacterium]